MHTAFLDAESLYSLPACVESSDIDETSENELSLKVCIIP